MKNSDSLYSSSFPQVSSYSDFALHAAVAQSPNQRDYMEDFVKITAFELKHGAKVFYYGVFDGHGNSSQKELAYDGATVAKFLVETLHIELEKELNLLPSLKDLEVKKAIIAAFKTVDEKTKKTPLVGSCALVALLTHEKLFVANLGDSKAILYASDKSISLSNDARLSNPHYYEKILENGATIVNQRVEGALNIAASFGDWFLSNSQGEKLLISTPEIHTYSLENISKNDFLLLGTDGIWERLTPKESIRRVKKAFHTMTLENFARKIVENSIGSGSFDNLSIIVVRF